MSQLPVKGQKPIVSQCKALPLQKQTSLPPQQKVRNQVGFYQETTAPAVRNINSGGMTEYRDLNDKKQSYITHGLYVMLALLVGVGGYLYAMKIKPAKVEVVEKVVEKTLERVEYVERAEPVATVSYAKIEVDTNVPVVARKPEKNRFEEDFKKEDVRRKYQKITRDLYQQKKAERAAYLSNRKNGAMDWAYAQIDHKYEDIEAQIKQKEYDEICEVTDSAFWCDYAAKYTAALKNRRSPAADNYPSYKSNSNTVNNGSEATPIYQNNPADNKVDFVGKPVEEI